MRLVWFTVEQIRLDSNNLARAFRLARKGNETVFSTKKVQPFYHKRSRPKFPDKKVNSEEFFYIISRTRKTHYNFNTCYHGISPFAIISLSAKAHREREAEETALELVS